MNMNDSYDCFSVSLSLAKVPVEAITPEPMRFIHETSQMINFLVIMCHRHGSQLSVTGKGMY